MHQSLFIFPLLISLALSKVLYPADAKLNVNAKLRQTPQAQDVLRVAECNNHFALDIYRLLTQSKPKNLNLAFCPISLTSLISMVYLGATGNTAAEINATLGYYATGLNEEQLSEAFRKATNVLVSKTNGSADYRTTLRLANSLWHRTEGGNIVETNFKDSLEKYFDAEVMEVEDFSKESCVEDVNKWVSKVTNGLITTALDQPPPAVTRLLLLSAVYFKSKWQTQFDPEETTIGRFRTSESRFRSAYDVPMMRTKLQTRHGRSENLKSDFIELPYQEKQISMLIIIPDDSNTLEMVESNMSPQLLHEAISVMKMTTVDLTLPRFEIKDTLYMKENLAKLGMSSLFDPELAELQGIDPVKGLYVSDVLQKVIIKVDEEGSEAAAVTSIIMSKKKTHQNVTIDRPFIFLIGHVQTGTILFMGRVAKP